MARAITPDTSITPYQLSPNRPASSLNLFMDSYLECGGNPDASGDTALDRPVIYLSSPLNTTRAPLLLRNLSECLLAQSKAMSPDASGLPTHSKLGRASRIER